MCVFNMSAFNSLHLGAQTVKISNQKRSEKSIFLVRMSRFFLTSGTIDTLCLVYSKFCTKKNNVSNEYYKIFFSCGNLELLNININRVQTPKSGKIEAFGQENMVYGTTLQIIY